MSKDSELFEARLKAKIFAVSPYYTENAPRLQEKVRKSLTDPNADELDVKESVERVEKLLRKDSTDPPSVELVTTLDVHRFMKSEGSEVGHKYVCTKSRDWPKTGDKRGRFGLFNKRVITPILINQFPKIDWSNWV